MMNKSLSRCWTLYRKQFPKLMLAVIIEVMLRLIVLAPLLLAVKAETRPGAVLCPVLFLLIVLPARQNAALAANSLAATGDFSVIQLVSPADYGKKLVQGLKAWPVLLWFLPFGAATGFLVYVATADTIEGFNDVFTVIRVVREIGGGAIKDGVIRVLLIYAATLIPGMIGLGFHSGLRHRFASGVKKFSHLSVLGGWLFTLLTFVPFAAVTAVVSASYVKSVVDALSNLMGGIHLPAPDANIIIIGVAFVVLCLPAIAFRTLFGGIQAQTAKERC